MENADFIRALRELRHVLQIAKTYTASHARNSNPREGLKSADARLERALQIDSNNLPDERTYNLKLTASKEEKDFIDKYISRAYHNAALRPRESFYGGDWTQPLIVRGLGRLVDALCYAEEEKQEGQ